MPIPIISDATCIIALHRIGRLSILKSLYGTIMVPPAVMREILDIHEKWIKVEEIKNIDLVTSLLHMLDAGESEAIALAVEHPRSLLITDDRKARKMALSFRVRITGTLGVLALALRNGLVEDLKTVIEELEREGFYMTRALKDEALALGKKKKKS